MRKKRTDEEYKNELMLIQPDVEVIDKYINACTLINHKCKIHNKIYLQNPSSALAGHCGCDDCKKIKMKKDIFSQRKTNDEFVKEMKEIWGDEIIPLEEYKTGDTKIKFLHNTEKLHNFIMTPVNITSSKQNCPVCAGKQICIGYNDIATTNPYIASLFLNEENTHKYTQGSGEKVDFKCECCGKPVGKKRIADVVKCNGVRCFNCNDGVSYPNKFIYNCLKQIEDQLQYLDREVAFDWCEFDFRNGKKCGRYDLYFEANDQKYIVEMDGGLGHGNISISNITKEETVYIDNQKDKLAKERGIEVIRINCYYDKFESRYEYIKNNIINSKLSSILDLSYIDFVQCDVKSCQSLLIEACNLWNDGMSVSEVAKELKMSNPTIINYLKIGTKNGLCIGYFPKASTRDGRKVINLNDRKVFESIMEASKYYKVNHRDIVKCCKRQSTFGGWYNGEKQIWMYYNEYIKLTKEEVEKYIPKVDSHPVKTVCLNTLQVFDTLTDAAKWCGLKKSTSIIECCKGKYKTAGKHPETGEPLIWMYYEDYIKLYGELNLEELAG